MSRKRLTQVFPFLLPFRKWQRKKLFYLKMQLDGNKYAKKTSENLLPNTVFETSSLMLNENSGFDMKYQINKVHNLKLAARTINKVIIEPNETFSFWQLVRWADHHEKYKDGLNLVDGKIVGSYGGGLFLPFCTGSNQKSKELTKLDCVKQTSKEIGKAFCAPIAMREGFFVVVK